MEILSKISAMALLELSQRKLALTNCFWMWTQSTELLIFRMLKEEGYELKNNFKKFTEPFAVVINKGQTTAVVLKKI
jgi:hypothetical protein